MKIEEIFIENEDYPDQLRNIYDSPFLDHDVACFFIIFFNPFSFLRMYYLGKQSVCFSVSENIIPDITEKTYGEFYKYIKTIKSCIINKEYDKLKEARNKLWNKYKSNFPNIYNDCLPKNL